MTAPSLSQATDITKGTLEKIMRAEPADKFLYSNYQFFNTFWKNRVQTRGDELKGFVTLGEENNAVMAGPWDDDAVTRTNIVQEYTVPWRYHKNFMMYNIMERDINGPGLTRIYDDYQVHYRNMMIKSAEMILSKLLTGPTSSTDVTNPYSVFSWLPQGTDGSTGDWTAYTADYNDGSTPGTAFNVGGLASSSSSNADWVSYYADHDGNLDLPLLGMLDDAVRKLTFMGPNIPEKIGDDIKFDYAMYTSNAVLKALNAFYANSDDNMGYRPDAYFGATPAFKRVPMIYTPFFDTANTSVFGTNPVLGINHNEIYPVVLEGWDFKIGQSYQYYKNHKVLVTPMDLTFQVWCNGNRKRKAGFLISQQ